MKKSILSLYLLCQTVVTFSQLEASFEKDNDTLSYSRLKSVDQIIHLPVTINGINTDTNSNKITFVVDPAQSTPGTYSFNNAPLIIKVNPGTTQVDCPVTLLKGQNTGNNFSFVALQMSYNNGLITKTKNLTLKIKNSEEDENENDASFFSRIMFLNAYNFDFNGKLSSNYVGKFNVYKPTDKIWHFGVNGGVMKINYGVDDSSTTDRYRIENVFIHPLDSIKAGNRYLRQFNKYATKVRNTAWSFYIQPLLRLNSSEKSKIFLHGHFELLVNKFAVTTTISNIQTDTGVFTEAANRSFLIRPAVQNEATTTTTLLNGYFGLGPTFDISLAKNSSLFIQGTIGKTTNYPQPASTGETIDNRTYGYSKIRGEEKWNDFYLVRVYYNQQISDAAKIVIATDIRGLFPRYNPLYATYIGLNLKLESLVETITGKK